MDNQLPGILDRYTPNPCNAEDLDVIAKFNEWRPSNYPWSLIVYRI